MRSALALSTPILITGAHRSGTTWAGRIFEASGEVGYLLEPFSPERPVGICDKRFGLWYAHVSPADTSLTADFAKMLRYRPGLLDVMRSARSYRDLRDAAHWFRRYQDYRRRNVRPLLKDPIALLSAEWLAVQFGALVVILIRHPAAFADSLRRKDWRFDFANLLAQRALVDNYLADFESEMVEATRRELSILDQAALVWRILYSVVARYQRLYPEWSFVRHEDLSLDPFTKFGALFAATGVTFNDAAQSELARSTTAIEEQEHRRDSKANTTLWRSRLSERERSHLRSAVEDVAHLYYADDDW